MLSTELQLALNAALGEARVRRHEYVTVEHLLFAILHDERGASVLRHAGTDLDVLKKDLLAYFDQVSSSSVRCRRISSRCRPLRSAACFSGPSST